MFKVLKLFYCLFFLVFATLSSAEELLSDQNLLSDSNAQGSVVGKAKKGDVTVLEKKGFWVKIKSGDQSGWVKLTNIKLNSSSSSLNLADTGRSADGNIVSTSGARGLDGGDLVNAKPDTAEFAKFQGYKTTKTKATDYASSGGLHTRSIKYIDQSNK